MFHYCDASSSTASTAKPGPSIADFTNTFVLSATANSKQILCEVPKGLSIDPSRQRRTHRKSRAGCDNCRRRSVKCNEEFPCANCTRRGDYCRRPVQYNTVDAPSILPSMSAQNLLPSSSASTGTVVNLLHLKLFHHFQTSTHQTLLFTPDVWAHASQLSFSFSFLMDAILCVAARHLAFLHPEDPTYPAAAAGHLGRALCGFRVELSNELTSTHLDVFIVTSVLLQFEMWTNIDFFSPRNNDVASFDPSRDRIFAFSSSLKQVFLRSFPVSSIQSSVFMPHIRNSPLDNLVGTAQISSGTLANFQDFFAYDHPLTLDLLNVPLPYTRGIDWVNLDAWKNHVHDTQDTPDLIKDGYMPVITRLCLILSFLSEASPPDSLSSKSPLLVGLARYMHSFPAMCNASFVSMCHSPFASMVHQSDPHALLLLYHFYRAVRILLPPNEYWWAHKRATVLETVLKEWLIAECT
ncbi:hypothetical protein K505DRAFT_244824 [Melanomma pulvis-pyrius CBS 109.77]|uniref:Zn(2)-C6 fungal-type domain-containing protein n=1 Tax=Melanomma pulvis-pyrius CBS 109.77 TaxID=1314802 RepID=A0A6A6XA47_9PLEO|nr:hypothetical protein K505DRAFT_244824 [Melanomma pulvis-pyrius CBS 109.77]